MNNIIECGQISINAHCFVNIFAYNFRLVVAMTGFCAEINLDLSTLVYIYM